MHFKSIGK